MTTSTSLTFTTALLKTSTREEDDAAVLKEAFKKAYDSLLDIASRNSRKHLILIESLKTRAEKLNDDVKEDSSSSPTSSSAKNNNGNDDEDEAYEKRTKDLKYFLEPIELAFGAKNASMEERAVICLTSLIGGRLITGR